MSTDELTPLEEKAYKMSRSEFVSKGHGSAMAYDNIRKRLAERADKGQHSIPEMIQPEKKKATKIPHKKIQEIEQLMDEIEEDEKELKEVLKPERKKSTGSCAEIRAHFDAGKIKEEVLKMNKYNPSTVSTQFGNWKRSKK